MPETRSSLAAKLSARVNARDSWVRRALVAAAVPVLSWSVASGAAEVATTRPAAEVAVPAESKSGDVGVVAFKPSGATAAGQSDGPALTVNRVELDYMPGLKRDGGPKLEDLISKTTVTLGLTTTGLVKWRDGAQEADNLRKVQVSLTAPTEHGNKFHISALQAIAEEMVKTSHKLGWVGIYVGIDARQLDMASLEADPEAVAKKWDANVPLKYLVLVGAVSEVRTVAAGASVPVDQRVNNPAYKRIKDNSPIQPVPGKNLLKQDVLEAYIDRLNRYPWRKVDVALAAGPNDGDVVMDYMVAQAKPWTAYLQLSNTGTDQTTKWRERAGFVHNNLTGRTDILSLDFVTGNFDEANALMGSYETPVYGERLRGRLFASWSQYTASDLGVQSGTVDSKGFDGDEWAMGAELIANLVTQRELFLDAVAGMRFKHTETDNNQTDMQGEADFWVPYLGLRVERNGETSTTLAHVTMEFGFMSDPTTTTGGESRDSADGLGRLEVDDQWQSLQADITHSFYLEPLLNPQGTSSLAHEFVLSGKMQWNFGDRLVPQEQMIAGGIYTVRGYPESIVAGDSVFIGSAEYRLHVPRLLGVQATPSKFMGSDFYWRPRPVQSGRPGRPDWDLVVKGFFDAGRVIGYDKLAYETDNTLASCGVGMDILFKQNMSLRVDYGVVLQDVTVNTGTGGGDGTGPNVGDGRLHVVFTIMY